MFFNIQFSCEISMLLLLIDLLNFKYLYFNNDEKENFINVRSIFVSHNI